MASSEVGLPAGLDHERLAALYAAPLEEFVARRGELARELVQSGAKEAAGWVKSLPKPVATAWAINRLVRERGEAVGALRQTGDDLRRAQEAGDRDALRRATEQRRTQVQGLVERAAEVLQAAGHQASLQAFQRLRRTLEAIAAFGSTVSLDPPLGRLHADLEPPGFETLFAVAQPASAPRHGPPRPVRAPAAGVGRGTAAASELSAAARKAAAARRLDLQRAATAAAERVEEARVAFREAETARERSERRADETERAVARQEERLREARAARDATAGERRVAERDAAAASKLLEKRRAELLAAQAKLRDQSERGP